jgi:glycosyltransferase involved in cell wall biosynthesis
MFITLIVPAHNEAARLPGTVTAYADALEALYPGGHEIIVVANGCSDDTAAIARGLQSRVAALRVIDIPEEIGKGGAVLEGFRAAQAPVVLFADADLATSPASLLALVAGLERHDIVVGSRWVRASVITQPQPLRRRVFSRLFNAAARVLFRIGIADTQCGAKALRRDAAHALADHVTERRWTFDLDMLLWARRLGYSVVEQPVTWADQPGSKLRVGSTGREVAGAMWRLFRTHVVAGGVVPASAPRPVTTDDRASDAAAATVPPMSILAFNWRCTRHREAGGSETNLFEQARHWIAAGHTVTVVTARGAADQDLPAEEMLDGVRVLRMGGRFTVYARAAFYLLRHGRRYDRVLDVANGIPFFTPLFTRTPITLLIHHVHDRQWHEEFPRLLAEIGRFLELRVVPFIYRRRAVIAVSSTTRDALLLTGFREDQVRIIHNGIERPRAGSAEDARAAGASPRIVYLGRLKKYKRLERLVDATAALLPAHPGLRLVIAGDGDARESIEETVRAQGIEHAVTMRGFVDDAEKARILASATVFATPSMHEGWGLSVIEANSYGAPAVAYDVPGLRVAIRHDETGLLAGDTAAFVDALDRILGQPELRARLSVGALAWSDQFDWQSSADETLSVLHSPDAMAPDVEAQPLDLERVA